MTSAFTLAPPTVLNFESCSPTAMPRASLSGVPRSFWQRQTAAAPLRVTPTGDRVVAVPEVIVRLGPERADLCGLSAGDQIVILGVHKLDEDLPVRIVEDVTGAGG